MLRFLFLAAAVGLSGCAKCAADWAVPPQVAAQAKLLKDSDDDLSGCISPGGSINHECRCFYVCSYRVKCLDAGLPAGCVYDGFESNRSEYGCTCNP